MKKLSLAVLASISAFVAAPAQAAVIESCTTEAGATCNVLTDTNSVFFEVQPAGEVGNTFSTAFTFMFGEDATVDSSVVSVKIGGLVGVSLTSVLFNALPFTPMPVIDGTQSFVLTPTQNIFAGQSATVTVNGTVLQAGGQFSGNLTAGPPVPEPSVWAMMLVGFGAVGYSMRRRPRYRLAQAV